MFEVNKRQRQLSLAGAGAHDPAAEGVDATGGVAGGGVAGGGVGVGSSGGVVVGGVGGPGGGVGSGKGKLGEATGDEWQAAWSMLEDIRKVAVDEATQGVCVKACGLLMHPEKRQPLVDLWRMCAAWPADALVKHVKAVLDAYD